MNIEIEIRRILKYGTTPEKMAEEICKFTIYPYDLLVQKIEELWHEPYYDSKVYLYFNRWAINNLVEWGLVK